MRRILNTLTRIHTRLAPALTLGLAFNLALGLVIGLVLNLAVSSPSLAQGSESPKTDINNQEFVGEAAKVLAVFDVWAKASTECDSSQLSKIYHPKISFWPSVAKKPFYGTENTIAVFEGMCKINPFLRVTPVNRYVDILGDTAVVFGALHFRRMLNEQLTEVPVRFSFTLIKEESEWKILHMQSVTIPFSVEDQAVESPDL